MIETCNIAVFICKSIEFSYDDIKAKNIIEKARIDLDFINLYYFKLVMRISVGHPNLLDAILKPSFAKGRLLDRT